MMHNHTVRSAPLFLLIFVLLTPLAAQRQLTIEDLESWNQIQSVSINAAGTHTAYVLSPDKGDSHTIVVENNTGKEVRLVNTDSPKFSFDGRFLLATRHPSEATLRAKKKQKDSTKGLDSLVVLELDGGEITVHPEIYKWATGDKWSDFYAYTSGSVLVDSLQKGLASKTNRLVVRRFGTSDSLSIEGVADFTLAEEAAAMLLLRPAHESEWTDGVHYIGPDMTLTTVAEERGTYEQPALSKDGQRAAFLVNLDTTDRNQPPFHLHAWTVGSGAPFVVSANAGEWIPKGFRISDDGKVRFSDTGDRLYFGVAPRLPEQDTSLLEEDIADVEVWTTEDERMYTEENVRAPREKKRTYLSYYHWPNKIVDVLGNPNRATVLIPEDGDSDWVVRYDEDDYLPRTTWEGSPSYKDIYLYNGLTGEEKLIAKEVKASPRWSPAGKYVYWYAYPDTSWFAYEVASGQLRTLTDPALGIFHEADDDHPDYPSAHGSAGWLENDEAFVAYDRFDWWLMDPTKEKSGRRLTDERDNQLRLRYLRLDPEKRDIPASGQVLVSTFSEDSYHGGYAWLDMASGKLRSIMSGPFNLNRPIKARLANKIIYTREDFTTFPNLIYTDYRLPGADENEGRQRSRRASSSLADEDSAGILWSTKTISDANPQQSEFGWGTAETYEWIDNQGRTLRGILVKPPNFDPNKKYPMMVNFYERSSDEVYEHRAPYPHRSTMNYSYYSNRGYVIFNPDVIYRVGYPGESAYDCVMSGVTALLGEGFVDRDRVGVQGHSWGGYQIAYLVTKTDLFACAESGAPVVNMFSAYGGIRWGSGRSRQFQYERTQSRIGGSPWEYPLRYVENSPLFTTDKVNTPLLIMHNDKDGAVPWYQGIEYFTALRRLGKPAWMLNYRGEPHWPLKQANRSDFQRRMSQFFDHYLMDAPRPRWMERGVSPLERGIEQGYETSSKE